jgi:S1-C subfamily serine protease
MPERFRSPFASALMGGLVVALAMVAYQLVEDDGSSGGSTQTVIQQAPISSSTSNETRGLTVSDIYDRESPGVVFVSADVVQQTDGPFGVPQEQQGQATGSGFVVDDKGYIVTNAHVVSGATKVTVSFKDNKTEPAKIVGRDPSNDLALLKVDPDGLDLSPLPLGSAKGVKVGDPVIAIGNPFGYDRTLTTGVISARQRKIFAPDGFQISNVLQTDAAINPGNSGGPLLDAAGRVIGINSQIATAGGSNGSIGIGFAIPIDTAKQLLPQLKKGSVQHAYLGIEGRTVDKSLDSLNLAAKNGVLIETVTPGGPADRAGIRGGDSSVGGGLTLGGDIAVGIDGKPLRSMPQLTGRLAQMKPGDKLTLTILREGRRRDVTVTLANRPASAAPTQGNPPPGG